MFVTSRMDAKPFLVNVIAGDLVRMPHLMRRSDAVVRHAGGAVNEVSSYGVPMVLAPVRAGQVALSHRVAAAGAPGARGRSRAGCGDPNRCRWTWSRSPATGPT
ncbi:hypothetical protein AB0H12_20705 [Actinosynnema sp. NPDC023794]